MSDDEEYFSEMSTVPSARSNQILDEPSTPNDENFYLIPDESPPEPIQAHIDEPITPTDEINPNFHYTILTEDEYMSLMLNYVEEVKTILQLPSSIIKLLLNHFKWDKQRLLEKFYEIDQDEFFRQAKIINPYAPLTSDEPSTNICSICCSDEPTKMFHLQCQHTFCIDCWKSYLINQIVQQGLAQTIVCPAFQCEILVDDQTIHEFLDQDEFVRHLYEKTILNSYVEQNPRARWCPGKNCGYIINASSLTSAYNYAQLITCTHCQTSFCFQCAQPWHDPIKCILLLQWRKKLLEEGGNVLWLRANTKICPKCRVNIEKNGGCNHMTCRNCKYEFCWLCFRNWYEHSECNRFDENAQSNENVLNIARYLHYHDRYRNHEHSLELESKLWKKIRSKLRRNRDQLSKNDLHLIEQAFQVLLACRQMLIYTYPLAYYLKKNNQSFLFEENQADLERACEELSRIFEQDLTKEMIFESIKRKLTEKFHYCQARREALLRHAKEGYTHNYWEYQDEVKDSR